MSDVFSSDLLRGKTAFLTGATSGIALGVAERLGRSGARVIINGRNPEKLDAAIKHLRELGIESDGVAADVRGFDELQKGMASMVESSGLDILVCGAAGNFPAPAAAMSPNGFKSVIDIDLLGTFNACRAAHEFLRQPGGVIINISAPQAYIPMALQSHVCAAKAGVDMVTRTLAIEWGPSGIRVNSIAPGPIIGTEGMKRLAPREEQHAALSRAIPLGRFGQKDEIADLALFLCSDAAQYITGTVIPCDGGQSLIGSGIVLDILMK